MVAGVGNNVGKFIRDFAVVGLAAGLLAVGDGTLGVNLPQPYASAAPAVALFIYRDLRSRNLIPGVSPKDD